MVHTACETAQDTIPTEGFPPDLARDLIECASGADFHEAMPDAFLADGYISVNYGFEAIRNARGCYPLELIINTNSKSGQVWREFYYSPLGRPLKSLDETTYAEMMIRVVDISRLPYYEAIAPLGQLLREIDDLPRARIWSRNQLPVTAFPLMSQARAEAMLDLIQLGLAVEQYRDQNGTYPETLDKIADLFETMPVDPFTGESYRYQITNDGFLLYSVGQNLIDDKGRHDYKTGDIVWRGKTASWVGEANAEPTLRSEKSG